MTTTIAHVSDRDAAIDAWDTLTDAEQNFALGWLANGRPEAVIAAASAAKASRYIDHRDT